MGGKPPEFKWRCLLFTVYCLLICLLNYELRLMLPVDILILSNGPGEITTWVRPVVKALRQQLGNDPSRVRISVVLAPCLNATGKEAAIALSYPEINRVQSHEHFFPFLLWGKTLEDWDWHQQGVVIFLGGDQFYSVIISKRLGYRSLVYAEWDARWYQWVDRFAVMNQEIVTKVPLKYRHKFRVVGDLMADVATTFNNNKDETTELIGLLPGSKPAKLTQGVPLCLAIAQHIQKVRPQTQFIIFVAPTIDLPTLAKFADPQKNPMLAKLGGVSGELIIPDGNDDKKPFLKTSGGIDLELATEFPAHNLLSQCHLCITTVGANTAELGVLAVPMLVLIPTQQLDAMRSWDGIPGILSNLPGIGYLFARVINWVIIKQKRLFAWPNIWAKEEIVPELVGLLQAPNIANIAIELLEHPQKLEQMRDRLVKVRGRSKAAKEISKIVRELLNF
jgi:lipid A disaccharide synthetase